MTIEDIFTLEPKLRELANEVAAVWDDKSQPSFCDGEKMQVTGELARAVIAANWACRMAGPSAKVPEDELEREVYLTPFDGAYGVAGHVVTINGSPPRLVAVVQTGDFVYGPYVWLCDRYHNTKVISDLGPKKLLPLRRAVLALVEHAKADLFENEDAGKTPTADEAERWLQSGAA